MDTLLQDIRYGARMLLKTPTFTFIAVIVIALGIGANTAIFSVVNAVLLKALPYPNSESVMDIGLFNSQLEGGRGSLGDADFLAIKEYNQSFSHVAGFSTPRNGFNLTGKEVPEQVIGSLVTADFFEVLQMKPMLGRTFLPDEDQPGKERVVVVSYAFWQKHLNGDPRASEQSISLNNQSYAVIGVMPKEFRFARTGTSEFWATIQIAPPQNRPPYYLGVIGRLQDGVTQLQAQADTSAIVNEIGKRFATPGSNDESKSKTVLRPLKTIIVGNSELPLIVLLGAVVFVLLIASVNVANLLLVRATGREKEMAIRAALGASRWRLIRQSITESLLLALIGGTLGLFLASWGMDLIVAFKPENLPRLDEMQLDGRVLLFTGLISMVSGLIFGLAPAIQSGQVRLQTALKEGGRSDTEGFAKRRLKNLLVVSELALALILLVGAGLMIRSFQTLQQVNPGFNPHNVVSLQINLPRNKYPDAAQVATFQQRFLQGVESLPGVESASLSMALPPNLLIMTNPFTVEGNPPATGEAQPLAEHLLVSPDYFKTLGIRLINGRVFTDADNQDAPAAIIINKTMAELYFAGQDPVGKRLQTGDYSPQFPYDLIVGVVDDVKYAGLNEKPKPTLYTPFLQNLWWRSMYVAVRTQGDPLGSVAAIRNEVWVVDKDLPVSNVKTMEQLMSESVTEPRALTTLFAMFGLLALILASIGIYGVMAYSVSQRTREIGIRLALGAQKKDILQMIINQGLRLAVIGVSIGLAGSFFLTRLMKDLLFGVSATDILTFAAVSVILTGVALVAGLVPARRAAKTDPMVALRYE
ncbi:MAG: ABC transporter permease [Acidobacteriota bacterium]